jgi:alpha-L-fucosidase 2
MKPIVDTLGRRDIFELGKRRAAQRHWSLANRSSIGAIAPYGTQSTEYGCESGGYDHEHGCPESFGDFEGIEFPCAMGPFWRNANNFDCAVRFNAGLSTTMLIDWFEFTQDRAFFNETLMPFLTGVADFYHSYALRSSNSSSGPLELQRTCAQEMCQQRQAGTGGGGQTPTEDNSLSDLAYARMVIQKLRQYQNISGQPLKQSWVELENRLVDFPLVERAGFGTGWAEATMNGQPVSVRGALGNNDYPIVYFSPIHPAQIVGLESPPAVLDAARNTLWAVNAMNEWHPNNGFCLGWPSAGRIMGRANGSKVLNAMTEAIKDACFPNFWPNLGGGGLEQAGGIEAINSLMLQSHESCVRVFPGWPDNNTAASFQSLRARRGFVVSASQLNGKVQSPISIASELGLPLSICLPPGWTNASVLSSDSRPVPMSLMDAEMRRWLVQTEPNATYSLVRLH